MGRITKNIRKIIREITLKQRKPSRYLLERKILPKIKNKKVLLVGCENYNEDYPKRLKSNELWTIDVNPDSAKFGSKNHVIGSITEAEKYFSKKYFDVILMIGVFGYGLNEIKEAEKSLVSCSRILKDKGLFIIQWSDLPGRNMINPKNLKNINLFTHHPMFGYPSPYKTQDRKVWEFLIKND